jgi:hypothetical protein
MSLDPYLIARAAVSVFFAILFLQSGMDKVTDWKGNLGWLTGHFEKSPLRGMAPLLLGTMTLFELATGLTSAAGAVSVLTSGPTWVFTAGLGLASLSLLMLFFGQRVAKDYPGAATIATYFAVAILGLLIPAAPGVRW